jgi:DNA-binding transcriptional regulator YhcF (GntR family)
VLPAANTDINPNRVSKAYCELEYEGLVASRGLIAQGTSISAAMGY